MDRKSSKESRSPNTGQRVFKQISVNKNRSTKIGQSDKVNLSRWTGVLSFVFAKSLSHLFSGLFGIQANCLLAQPNGKYQPTP